MGLPPEKISWIFPAYYWSHLQLTIKPQEIDAIFNRSRPQRLIMPDTYLRWVNAPKRLKHFKRLLSTSKKVMLTDAFLEELFSLKTKKKCS